MNLNLFFLLFLFLMTFSCSHKNERTPSSVKTTTWISRLNSLQESRSWEIKGPKGAIVVPDLFYADPIQNLQGMPLGVKIPYSHKSGTFTYEINNFIYPTIGNPTLYTKEDPKDLFFVALRVPSDIIALNRPQKKPLGKNWTYKMRSRPKVYILSRKKRKILEWGVPLDNYGDRRKGVYPVEAATIVRREQKGAPIELLRRETLLLYFKKSQLENIPPGFYDVRVEWKFGPLASDQIVEWQYNSLRIFKAPPKNGKYRFLNMADTQISLDHFLSFKQNSLDKFAQFKDFLNKLFTLPDKNLLRKKFKHIVNSKFITFNGDFHNSGSPAGIRSEWVSKIPAREGAAAISVLRDLPLPIFLTMGNHDGHVNMGHRLLLGKHVSPLRIKKWQERIQRNNELIYSGRSAYHGKKALDFIESLKKTKKTPGGREVDIFHGIFKRTSRTANLQDWGPLQKSERNYPLYDASNQWRKLYGTNYSAWNYGDGHLINLNTYDLRQHSRAGWGLFIMNYGGGISSFQMGWVKREVAAATRLDRDIILIGHHDPRGGHKDKDRPYYYPLLDYKGVQSSAKQWFKDEILADYGCRYLPGRLLEKFKVSCVHTGLLEWMFPDFNLDCWDKSCPPNYVAWALSNFKGKIYFSGPELVDLIIRTPNIRTVLLGHTHHTTLKTYYPGSNVAEDRIYVDDYGIKRKIKKILGLKKNIYPFKKALDGRFYLDLTKLQKKYKVGLGDKEVSFLRTTSLAKQTHAKAKWKNKKLTNYGFTIFGVNKKRDYRKYKQAQINRAHFYVNTDDGGKFPFLKVHSMTIKRALGGTEAENAQGFDQVFEIEGDSGLYQNPIRDDGGNIFYDSH
jgi:hypothetical protein